MELYVGCSGWFYWHWRGLFYPTEEGTRTWFSHYTRAFRTVELNAPFYRWPKQTTVQSWRRAAPSGFRYSVKVNQLITHEKRLVRTRKLIRDFYFVAEILGPQLGCFLFQFPPSYIGQHTVCAEMTRDFLDYSVLMGNDLVTPHPESGFAGLAPGDRWCVCVTRWKQALERGVAPPVDLEATHSSALEFVTLEELKAHAL